MEKTVLIANSTDMPVAVREASIYSGISIAEFYRDMGYDIGVCAGSLSRWGEALREISVYLGEMPGESGFPTYLSSKLHNFFDRAGKIKCSNRNGSLSILSTISPTGGITEDPVVTSTLELVQVFWAIDRKLAQKRQYPSVNWRFSFSKDLNCKNLNYQPEWHDLIAKSKDILKKADELSLLNPDDLSDIDKFTLRFANSLTYDFLSQNVFSEHDRFCPRFKGFGMLKSFIFLYEHALSFLSKNDYEYTNFLETLGGLLYDLSHIKFTNFKEESILLLKVKELNDKIENAFS